MKQLIDLGRVPTRENMENTPLCDAVPICNVDIGRVGRLAAAYVTHGGRSLARCRGWGTRAPNAICMTSKLLSQMGKIKK